MIEIAKNRFVAANSLRGANIYQKDGKYRIAFKVDTQVKEEQTVFSDAFETEQGAKDFLSKLSIM